MERLVSELVDWIEIPSVTGAEGDYGDALCRKLEGLGFDVERQELAPGRFNVLARAGEPELVFCTHLDTVPPFFGASVDADFVRGRGSCDAKGQAACQIEAGRRLVAAGERRIGFLFTVGEETDSAGAQLADARLADPWRPRHVVIGEPTDGRYVRGHKGIFKATLEARGKAGHSSQDVGPSAVHELVHCCHRLLSVDWGRHPVLGPGTLNIGVFHGGVASNVVADRARAELLIRAVEGPGLVGKRVNEQLGPHVSLAGGSKAYAPIEFHVPPRALDDAQVVAFGTDAPYMPRWGRPVLYGPGSILDAHTDDEKVGRRELERAVEELIVLARELLDTHA